MRRLEHDGWLPDICTLNCAGSDCARLDGIHIETNALSNELRGPTGDSNLQEADHLVQGPLKDEFHRK